MKRFILSTTLAILFFSSDICAASEIEKNAFIDGNLSYTRNDLVYNTNPYNVASYTGVGESGFIKIYTQNEIFNIPIKSPLYKLSNGYKDRIINKNGIWGVERNVGIYTFTGNEDWEVYIKNSYVNDSTTIYKCTSPINVNILNGYSSHFDVLLPKEQKTNILDGLSFSADGNDIIMRFMNVRNVVALEDLKWYLNNQIEVGTPIKLLYFLDSPTFEPFEYDIQLKLNSVFNEHNKVNLGFVDSMIDNINFDYDICINNDIFNIDTFGSKNLDMFFTGIEDIKIYNSGNENYFINSIYADKYKITLSINDSNNNIYTGSIFYYECDFTKNKTVEMVLKSDTNNNVIIRVQLNPYNIVIPYGEYIISNKKPLDDKCKENTQFVLPEKIYFTDKGNTNIYLSNTIISGDINSNSEFNINYSNNKSYIFDKNVIKPIPNEQNIIINYSLNDISNNIEFQYVDDNIIKNNINIMFLGDSIINQNYYSKFVKDLFLSDNIDINLIGTRGDDDNKHEGRGGWSAYDYCNNNVAFGYTNPFLNNGKFDFKYYMNNNNFDDLDYVVINLGINDLNLRGHNTYNEIFKNFDTIIESIHNYDNNIQIIINTPELLYEKDDTNTAKNQRLNFTKSLIANYKDVKNITICPLYLTINPRTDYKLIEQKLNEENQNNNFIATDTTHPNIYGYKNMSNMTYTYIKYIESMK